MKKIVGYRKSLCHKLDGKWEWACPVWFNNGMFANAWIRGTDSFDSKEKAVEDMTKTLRMFGITKRTPVLEIKLK